MDDATRALALHPYKRPDGDGERTPRRLQLVADATIFRYTSAVAADGGWDKPSPSAIYFALLPKFAQQWLDIIWYHALLLDNGLVNNRYAPLQNKQWHAAVLEDVAFWNPHAAGGGSARWLHALRESWKELRVQIERELQHPWSIEPYEALFDRWNCLEEYMALFVSVCTSVGHATGVIGNASMRDIMGDLAFMKKAYRGAPWHRREHPIHATLRAHHNDETTKIALRVLGHIAE